MGTDITTSELVPNMERFLSDKNPFKEAKLGGLKNLHIFLREVGADLRTEFLEHILRANEAKQFEWREKVILASNIGHFSMLYDMDTVYNRFLPIFFLYCFDPVAKVSETASFSLALILESLKSDIDRQEALMLIVRKYFFRSETYKRRRLFVLMCGEALNHKELFLTYFKKDMLTLAEDRVISVRMALGRVLKHHYVTLLGNSLINNDREVNSSIKKLQADRSSDIRQLVANIPLFDPEVMMSISELSTTDGQSLE